ncbi:hypothetical protein EN41_21150 [Agrobacterium tumefaciens]|nr:hypothetical protein EN41_21150 [Agrobacterium tumefaciens]
MSTASFYKWRAKYSGMDAAMISQIKALEEREPATEEDECLDEHAGRIAQRGLGDKVTRPSHRRDGRKSATQAYRVYADLPQSASKIFIDWPLNEVPRCKVTMRNRDFINHDPLYGP